jgi:hypothetical protein
MERISRDAEKALLDVFFFDGMDNLRDVVILLHFIRPARPIRHHKNCWVDVLAHAKHMTLIAK